MYTRDTIDAARGYKLVRYVHERTDRDITLLLLDPSPGPRARCIGVLGKLRTYFREYRSAYIDVSGINAVIFSGREEDKIITAEPHPEIFAFQLFRDQEGGGGRSGSLKMPDTARRN